MIGTMIGVFGGGVIGLSSGYFGLCFFGGDQYNFLDLPLPWAAAAPSDDDSSTGFVDSGEPVDHPLVGRLFERLGDGDYVLRQTLN